MKWIGLTGGIACGKSSVCRLLAEQNISIIDADEVAKEVVQPGSPGLKSVLQEFGEDLRQEDGSLNRRKLGQKVFGNPNLLRKLERITHPLIRAEVLRQRQHFENLQKPLVIYEIPLLFEIKAQAEFDAIIVISCTREQQRERLRLRNHLNENEIEMRIASQIPIQFKEEQANFVLYNNKDEPHLRNEVARLLSWLSKSIQD